MHGTTILCVRQKLSNDKWDVAIGGDGQISLGDTIKKNTAVKVRKICVDKRAGLLLGFAGKAADAIVMMQIAERLSNEDKGLEAICIEIAESCRNSSRPFEATLLLANQDGDMFLVSGVGDVIDPGEGHNAFAIGSGSNYAESAALCSLSTIKRIQGQLGEQVMVGLSSKEIVQMSLRQAARTCIYTNDYITVLTCDKDLDEKE